MSKPVLGMLLGLATGAIAGLIALDNFAVEPWLDRLCLVGACMLLSQLLGATIAAALGKPHQVD